MSKKQFNELELQFQEECEVINLKYEYDGYNGDISWAIISNLTEDEILEKFKYMLISKKKGLNFFFTDIDTIKNIMLKEK